MTTGSTTDVATHLVRRGLTTAAPPAIELTPMTGGVSNDVVAARAPDLDVVVKRALSRLRVAEEWLADPARLGTEGRALRLADRLAPGAVPRVLDLSEDYLVIERAPAGFHPWKEDLLAGEVDLAVAAELGRVLGVWQRTTTGDAAVAAAFGDITAFTQLRVDPFHRTIAQRHPDLAAPITATVEVMARSRTCLVHGDYTPKNVLVGGPGTRPWVIDWEVAHLGDATFDPAWLVGHLLLKTAHRPAATDAYAAAARAFLTALDTALTGSAASDATPLDTAQLVRQTGCLLLARVDGKSPADYLDDTSRSRVRELARSLLTDPPTAITDAWELLA